VYYVTTFAILTQRVFSEQAANVTLPLIRSALLIGETAEGYMSAARRLSDW
jgi:hypothetical protein